MKKVLQLVGGLSVLLGLVVVALFLSDRLTDPARGRVADATALVAQVQAEEQAKTAKQQAELERQAAARWQGYQREWIEPASAFLTASLPAAGSVLAWAIVGAVSILVVGGAVLLVRRWSIEVNHPLIAADRSGLLPFDRRQVKDLTAIAVGLLEHHQAARGEASIEAARKPMLPQTLTFSPHYSVKNDRPALPEPQPEPVAEPPTFQVPTFADLLTGGKIGEGQPLLLGFDASNGEAMTGSWLDLYSTAVAGMSGTGKTTSQRFLAAQVALQGARFVVVDPHAGAGADSLAGTLAPLSTLFLCEPASTDKQILDAVRLVADIGRRRVAGQDRDRAPVILWLDECTSLLGRGAIKDELATLLETIAQEYRKRWVFACASGQIWTASRSGGSELRDSFASVLCHRMKRAQARLLLPTDEAATVERLATGSAVLWRTSGESAVVRVPNTTQHDIEGVARLIGGEDSRLTSGYQAANFRLTSEPEAWVEVSRNGSHSQREVSQVGQAVVSAEALRAWAMFTEQRLDPAAIVLELRGVKSNQGATYQRALADVLELIRQGGTAGAA